MTVAEIKDRAIQQVHKFGRGVGALALINTAKTRIADAERFERENDLKNSLDSYTKAICLVTMCLDTTEFKAERAGGVLHREVQEFQTVRSICASITFTYPFCLKHEGRVLTTAAKSLETKLLQLEQSARCVITALSSLIPPYVS